MADITIANQLVFLPRIDRFQPVWINWDTPLQLINTNITGILSGTVKVANVLQVNAIVTVYYRNNGKFVARVLTDVNGAWSVSNLDKSVDDYYAIVQTEGNSNALIYDKLTPL